VLSVGGGNQQRGETRSHQDYCVQSQNCQVGILLIFPKNQIADNAQHRRQRQNSRATTILAEKRMFLWSFGAFDGNINITSFFIRCYINKQQVRRPLQAQNTLFRRSVRQNRGSSVAHQSTSGTWVQGVRRVKGWWRGSIGEDTFDTVADGGENLVGNGSCQFSQGAGVARAVGAIIYDGDQITLCRRR